MSFHITILGSNSALPAYGRNHSSQLLQIEDLYMLIDCGEGTQLKLARFKSRFQKINHIFISHLHGDHYLGLMGLLFTMNLHRRTKPLYLYSQPGLEKIITLQLKYSHTSLHFDIIFKKLNPSTEEIIFENERLTITSFPLNHRIDCNGFRFQEKKKPLKINKDKLHPDMKLQHIALLKQGKDVYDDSRKVLYHYQDFTLPPKKSRSYAYCSDTRYSHDIIPFIKGVDLLYHEATFLSEHEERARHTYHSTTEQAAKIAQEAEVGQLMIGHYSARYRNIEPFLEETAQLFPETILAVEGQTVEILEI